MKINVCVFCAFVCVCMCVRAFCVFVCANLRTCVCVCCVCASVRVCVYINIVFILVVETFKTTNIHKHVRINIQYKQYCLNMSIIQWSFFQCSWLFTFFMIQFKSTLQLLVALLYFISFRFFHIMHFVSMIKVFTNLVLDGKVYIPKRADTSSMSSSFNK